MLIEKVAQTGTIDSNYRIGTVLWENPDITQIFVAQDITLNDDISNYDYYRIIYVLIKDSPSLDSVFLPTTDTAYMSYNANYIARRTSNTPSGATIHVNDAYYNQTYGQSGSVDNRYCIPVKVIGYKNTIPTVVQKEWQVYDDQERVVGTWFGKPLYQITKEFDNSGTGDKWFNSNLTNTDKLFIFSGYAKASSGKNFNLPFINSANSSLYNIEIQDLNATGQFKIFIGSNWTGTSNPSKIYITFRYTKTTD